VWEIRNRTAFVTERIAVVDKTGERHWIVVVKGTFDIRPNGELAIAEEQVPVKLAPEFRAEDGKSSLVYEQDLIAAKPRTDLYLNALAHAPEGRPATEVLVGLTAPRVNKSLVVRGDRVWERNLMGHLEPTPPLPFLRMPLVYERAYGGYDQQDPDPSQHRLHPYNPVGRGFFTSRAHRRDQPLPNVEFPGHPMDAEVAGFGATCSYWQPRIAFQGTYDAAWVEHQKPLLPVDYDPRNLLCAPLDQQFEPHLRGGEPIGLVNLTPAGILQFAVPKHYFGFLTKIGLRRHEHRSKINTVIVEPEYPRVIVVWHSTLSCHHEIDDIDETVVAEKRYV
jgi:hypothetical protein